MESGKKKGLDENLEEKQKIIAAAQTKKKERIQNNFSLWGTWLSAGNAHTQQRVAGRQTMYACSRPVSVACSGYALLHPPSICTSRILRGATAHSIQIR